jgi:hypothetical protein
MGIHIVFNPITGETLSTIGPDVPEPEYEHIETVEDRVLALEDKINQLLASMDV